MSQRIAPKIQKTIKLFINGEFPRTESGRSFPAYVKGTKTVYAHLCLASRKDHRTAVTAAVEAQKGWAGKSAYNRSQILYRMAEMMESKRGSLTEIMTEVVGLTTKVAKDQLDQAIDAFVYYAGFADKYQQIIGAVNPVNGPHHNFTTPEAVGVVGLICGKTFSLPKICADIAAIACSGNTLVVLLPENSSPILSELGEVFATSDLPKGCINLLSGSVEELAEHFGSHMEMESLSFQYDDANLAHSLQKSAVENMKRFVSPREDLHSVENILNFVEYKTVWHPIGVW